ncbi:MAG: GspE/PulE family protein [Candidatus Buchananbacteria bacterium]
MNLLNNKTFNASPLATLGAQQNEAVDQLNRKMQEINLKQKEQETENQAQSLGLSYINLKGFGISPSTIVLLTREEIEKYRAVIFLHTIKETHLGVVESNPQIEELINRLNEQLHTKIILYLISENSLITALKIYDALPLIKKVVRGVQITEGDLKKFSQEFSAFKELSAEINRVAGTSLSEVVTLIISGGLRSRASDVHIEAEENSVKIRYRIDGVLTDISSLPKDTWVKIISRLKLLAGLKINVNDRPQDGRFSIFLTGEKIDVRVSCLPTQFGESVVIRLLMSTAQGVSFENLGLEGRAYEALLKEIKKPTGVVISTGPTGAGKTTTLYAILNKLNQPDIKIITIEDPIEYQLSDVSQSQVDTDSGYTFAKGLRYIVRQDPDIIMVGEVRDVETGEIAVQAALTGHAVFTTLHTNDAAGAVPRLLSLGVKPYLLAPALNAIIGQRLVRKICQNCKQEISLDAETTAKVTKILDTIHPENKPNLDLTKIKFYAGQGCDACQHLGYLGRLGIFEVLIVDDEIERAILAAETSSLILKELATAKGMLTMLQDGLLKAAKGLTTVDEVFRVVSE